jgi:hypothetical protein
MEWHVRDLASVPDPQALWVGGDSNRESFRRALASNATKRKEELA